MKATLLFILLGLACNFAVAQAKLRKLASNINHPSINNYAPYMSLDGYSMVYISDAGEDYALVMTYTRRTGVNWSDPAMFPKWISTRLNFERGFALSPDGNTLYLTVSRSSGMGGFDIYTSQLKGKLWSEPENMLLPVNSSGNDGCPTIALDGSMMVYMRCEKMDFKKADGCKLMWLRKKPNGQWGDPVEMPSYINAGNSQAPRMMGDNQTLIFSSNKLSPSKGGMDLYMTRLKGSQWSTPVPLDFVNTAGDDQYVTASAVGMYLVKEVQGQRTSELVEMLFPPELRPGVMVTMEGAVSGIPDLSSAFVGLYDLTNQKTVVSTRPGKDGSFTMYGPQGGQLYVSVDPEQDNYAFYSKTFDLSGENLSNTEKLNVVLKPIARDDELVFDGPAFRPNSSQLTENTKQDLKRLGRLISANPARSFAIEVTLHGYARDSVRLNPDLTEIAADTFGIPVQYKIDSVTIGTRDSLVVRPFFHNNRTHAQASAISEFLKQEGVHPSRIACSGTAKHEAVLENRKTVIRVLVH